MRRLRLSNSSILATGRWNRRTLLAWLRPLALLAIVLCVPGPADLGREVLGLISGAECCAGDCGDEGGECPGSCLHCPGCTHASALPVPAVIDCPALRSARLVAIAKTQSEPRRAFVSLPFRPPDT